MVNYYDIGSMPDEEYERIKKIAIGAHRRQSEIAKEILDTFEKLFESFGKRYESKDSYDGWLDEKDRYCP
jgi:hypothetical protein